MIFPLRPRKVREVTIPRSVKSLYCVGVFATPWTVACQASLSMGCSRQEYWSGLSPVVLLLCPLTLLHILKSFIHSFIHLLIHSTNIYCSSSLYSYIVDCLRTCFVLNAALVTESQRILCSQMCQETSLLSLSFCWL